MRRSFLQVGIVCLFGLPQFAVANSALRPTQAWPLWDAYVQRFVQQDGRVIDWSSEAITTSEGQANSLFFALVANDRARFDLLLGWAQNNLAGGDLERRLPAWQWGRNAAGRWGVLDPNPATDSDMWLTYTLLQAGSLWQDKRYTRLGQAMLARIKAEEIGVLPGLGPMLLPGPSGFAVGGQAWRLNPSYLAPQLLRAFAQADPDGPWLRIAQALPLMLRGISAVGLAPDWLIYDATKGWLPDTTAGAYVGSYDAIRVYLWAGLLDDGDPLKPILLSALHGMRDYLLRHQPALPMEKNNVRSGQASGRGPAGFSAALLPYLEALHEKKLVDNQLQHLKDKNGQPTMSKEAVYYDQVLALFGLGAWEKRFRFDQAGQLVPSWDKRGAGQ